MHQSLTLSVYQEHNSGQGVDIVPEWQRDTLDACSVPAGMPVVRDPRISGRNEQTLARKS